MIPGTISMMRLDNKVAVITGAAQGLGEAFAQALAKQGAQVVVSDIIDGTRAVDGIRAAGGRADFVRCDVTDIESVRALVAEVTKRFQAIDILVSNAAIFSGLPLMGVEQLSVEDWDRVMAVNVRGPFLCAQAVLPGMRARRYGRIINITSATVFKGTPSFLHYVTSKGAVLAMTKSLAREVGADNICVNALAPGLVLSQGVIANKAMREKLTPSVIAGRAIPREQVPDDLLGALVYLASEECRFMTGQVLVVDGGNVMH
jgi:NAD(P)-dependent dehydrogenase (short-subunit alcohol dehydrogenase family)